MEFHASKRELHGISIPIIKSSIHVGFFDDMEEDFIARSQRKECEILREKTDKLYYTIYFLENRICSHSLAKECRIRVTQDVEDMPRTVDDEIECLEANRKDTLKRLLDLRRSVDRYLIDPTFSRPFSTPRWLLRAFHDKSCCQYDENIGFLSSRYMWNDPGLSFDDLITAQVISEKSLRKHCEEIKPTPFISMVDDAAALLRIVKSPSFPGTTRIAFIDVTKLELMGVVHGLGRSWAMEAGAELYSAKNRHGIQYLGPAHWLAYDWIPVQCIDYFWSLHHFHQVCSECEISEGSFSLLSALLLSRTDKSHGKSSTGRVSAEKLIAKSKDLSNRLKESMKLR